MVLEKQDKDSGISDSGISLSTDGGLDTKSSDAMSAELNGDCPESHHYHEADAEYDNLHYGRNHKAIECALCRSVAYIEIWFDWLYVLS